MKEINTKNILKINRSNILMGLIIGIALIISSIIGLSSSSMVLIGAIIGGFVGLNVYDDEGKDTYNNWIEETLAFVFDMIIVIIVAIIIITLANFTGII